MFLFVVIHAGSAYVRTRNSCVEIFVWLGKRRVSLQLLILFSGMHLYESLSLRVWLWRPIFSILSYSFSYKNTDAIFVFPVSVVMSFYPVCKFALLWIMHKWLRLVLNYLILDHQYPIMIIISHLKPFKNTKIEVKVTVFRYNNSNNNKNAIDPSMHPGP